MKLDSKFFDTVRIGQRIEASMDGGRKITATLYVDSVPWVDVRSYLAGVPGSGHRDVRRQSFDFVHGRWSKTKTPLTDEERVLGEHMAGGAASQFAAVIHGREPLDKLLRSAGKGTLSWEAVLCEPPSA